MFRRFTPCLLLFLLAPLASAQESPGYLLKKNDRVAWIGSSSTRIGIWPQTMEFLLRTRQPDLNLTFQRFTTGGGTFATGLKNLDRWLAEYRPTVVFVNYGGNDANAGEKGLPEFRRNVETFVERVEKSGARVILMTHQAGDVHRAKALPTLRRKLYAETLLKLGLERKWNVIDVFHPLEDLQLKQEKKDPSYTILKDSIHLTPEAYIAWGFFLYKRIHPPSTASAVHLKGAGAVINLRHCEVADIKADASALRFTRRDNILPLLPPGPLPPLEHVPILEYSSYWLQVTELKEGAYDIRCDGKFLGDATHEILARGLNLNELVLVNKTTPPWTGLVQDLWNGERLDQIGRTSFRFEIIPRKVEEGK